MEGVRRRGSVVRTLLAVGAELLQHTGHFLGRQVAGRAEAARQQGLQGKAIRYYRDALERDPGNFAAISGEGAALVEKGALEKAKKNLAKLQSLCGDQCPETVALQSTIARGVPARLAVETKPDSAPVSN